MVGLRPSLRQIKDSHFETNSSGLAGESTCPTYFGGFLRQSIRVKSVECTGCWHGSFLELIFAPNQNLETCFSGLRFFLC